MFQDYEKFVDEALAGLFAQTWQPLDVIIVDDCSTDRSAEIDTSPPGRARKPTAHPNFIRNERNMVHPIPGILGLVEGRFVIVASADDVMLPHMVETMAKTWIEEKVSVVTGNALYIDEGSNYLNRTFRPLDVQADDSFETLARWLQCLLLWRRDGFRGRDLPDIWLAADRLPRMQRHHPALLRLFPGGARFMHEPLLKYRVHSRNSSLSLQSEKLEGEAQLLANDHNWRNHIAHAVFFDEEIDRLLAMAPDRFASPARRVRSLVKTQITEMARKLDSNRRALHQLRGSR